MTVIDRVTVRCRACGNEQQAAGGATGFRCTECGTAWQVLRCRSCRRASIVSGTATNCPRCGTLYARRRPAVAAPRVIGGSVVPGPPAVTPPEPAALTPAAPTPAVPEPVATTPVAAAPVVAEPVQAPAHQPLDLTPDGQTPLPVLVTDALWKLSRLREQGMLDENEVRLLREHVLGILLPAQLGPADDTLPTKEPARAPRVGRLRRRREAKAARAAAAAAPRERV